jgi:dienelactone hydrolase
MAVFLKKLKSYPKRFSFPFFERRKTMRSLFSSILLAVLLLLCAGQGLAEQNLEGKTVEYSVQGVGMKGFLAFDEKLKERRPGVLVVHEWWGLNEYARKRARMLAEMGYVALAVDMYGEGKQAAHPADAGKFSSELMKNFDLAKARFMAAMDLLKKQPAVDPPRIAAIGYCFGGGVVLNMARQGVDLRGVASFHGALTAVQPARRGSVKAKILVLTGADDRFVTPEQVKAFEEEMKSAGADYRLISYPGAQHSFTNPEADRLGKEFNLPLQYNPDADKKSWNELSKFLKEVFKK